jgi:hypothetical protein
VRKTDFVTEAHTLLGKRAIYKMNCRRLQNTALLEIVHYNSTEANWFTHFYRRWLAVSRWSINWKNESSGRIPRFNNAKRKPWTCHNPNLTESAFQPCKPFFGQTKSGNGTRRINNATNQGLPMATLKSTIHLPLSQRIFLIIKYASQTQQFKTIKVKTGQDRQTYFSRSILIFYSHPLA